MSEAARPPKVVPAPVLVILCIGAGLLAHRLHPVPVFPDLGLVNPVVAIVFCVAALSIGLAGVREFHRHGTPTNPHKRTTAFVTSGVFRRTRNPMYLGFVLLTVGLAIAFDSLPLLLAAALLAVLLDVLVVRPEERLLSEAFGEEFEAYRRRTRRWL